jgi:hypothetical protein
VLARHAVMPPPSPEPYRSRESVRGGSAWKPGGSCMAGWKGDAPLTGNWDARAWLGLPLGATPVPLGWAAGVVCGEGRADVRPHDRVSADGIRGQWATRWG